MSPLAVVAAVAVAAPALAAGTVVLGVRRRHPRVVRAVNRWQRSSANPRQLATAGAAGARTSVVEHVGRRSGRPYETPVGATAVGGDLVVMLPYGAGTDWVRNVRAAGRAVVRHDGRRLPVAAPEVLPVASVAAHLGRGDLWASRLFGIREVLVLHPTGVTSRGQEHPAAPRPGA